MHLVGRYTMTRLYGAPGVSARFVLDRGRAQWPSVLRRYSEEDWVVGPDGIACPALRGGAGWSARTQTVSPFLGYPSSASTASDVALTNAYTYNSAGNAIAGRIVLPSAKTLSSLYYFVTTHNGSPTIDLELRPNGSSKPGDPADSTGTSTPGGTGWKTFTSLSQAIAAGTMYWAVVADADGDGTNNVTLRRSISTSLLTNDLGRAAAFSTTDGWASVVTAATNMPTLVYVFNDSTVYGYPITASAVFSSSTNRRGWNISAGFTEQLKILGMVVSTGLSNPSGLEAYEGTTLPGGTTVASGTTVLVSSAASGATIGYTFDTPSTVYTAPKSTALRFVLTFSGATTSGTRMQIGTGADATLRSALWGGGNNYVALANATTDWSNDNSDEQFNGLLLIEDQVTISSGGGRLVIA